MWLIFWPGALRSIGLPYGKLANRAIMIFISNKLLTMFVQCGRAVSSTSACKNKTYGVVISTDISKLNFNWNSILYS